jgi:hypothetical protein
MHSLHRIFCLKNVKLRAAQFEADSPGSQDGGPNWVCYLHDTWDAHHSRVFGGYAGEWAG